ncbi:MAG: hypothetical protein IJ032_03440, partial [Clostridia bacterium]|nr:hypothetical protein [Clostridia bacterium]
MKKLCQLLLCLMLVAVIVAVVPHNATADTSFDDDSYQNTETYKFLQQFVADNPQRSNQQEELIAADWILQRFSAVSGVNVAMVQFTVNG